MFSFDFALWEQYISIAAAWGVIWFVLLWLTLVLWTYHDIRARSRNIFTHFLSILIVLVFFLPGIALYLIFRPRSTLEDIYQQTLEEEALLQSIEEKPACPGCNRKVKEDWVICPSCNTTLRKKCTVCAKLMELPWNVCPYCATLTREAHQVKEDLTSENGKSAQPLDDSWSDFDIIPIQEQQAE